MGLVVLAAHSWAQAASSSGSPAGPPRVSSYDNFKDSRIAASHRRPKILLQFIREVLAGRHGSLTSHVPAVLSLQITAMNFWPAFTPESEQRLPCNLANAHPPTGEQVGAGRKGLALGPRASGVSAGMEAEAALCRAKLSQRTASLAPFGAQRRQTHLRQGCENFVLRLPFL